MSDNKYNQKQHRVQKYGLFSIISLVIGSIISVAAYFKIGKLISLTKGNILSMVLIWLIAIIIIFATSMILISMLSSKKYKNHNGGIIHIIDEYLKTRTSKFINILFISEYSPIIIIIESVVATKFLFVDFFQINNNLILFFMPIFIITSFMYINSHSTKIGKFLQYGSLFIKLTPLVVLILFGVVYKIIFKHDVSNLLVNQETNYIYSNVFAQIIAGMPVALFALDGWQWGSGLAAETKGGTKTVIKATIIGLIISSLIYITYTIGGINILAAKNWKYNSDISIVFNYLFNLNNFGKILDIFVVVSALGGVNAFSIYYIRQIEVTADKKWLPNWQKYAKLDSQTHISTKSANLGSWYLNIVWIVIVIIGIIFPQMFNTSWGENFDITASINLLSEVLIVGIWSMVYIPIAYIAVMQRKIDKTLEYKINKYLFYPLIIIMIIGAIFATYVNFIQAAIVWIFGVIYILILTIFLPNEKKL